MKGSEGASGVIAAGAVNGVEGALGRMREDPLLFGRVVFGVERYTGEQERIARMVVGERKVAVAACHTSGKTFMAALLCWWFAWTKPGSNVVTTATQKVQLTDVLWGEIRGLYERRRVEMGIGKLPVDLRVEIPFVTRGGVRVARSLIVGLSPERAVSMQGYHKPEVLVVFDEAAGIPEGRWDAANSLMATPRCRWLAIGNPEGPEGRFHEAFTDLGKAEGWVGFHISAMDHPNVVTGREVISGAVTRGWVEDMRNRYTEAHPEYRRRVLGQFAAGGTGSFLGHPTLQRICGAVCEGEGRRLMSGEEMKIWGEPAGGDLYRTRYVIGADAAGDGEKGSRSTAVVLDRLEMKQVGAYVGHPNYKVFAGVLAEMGRYWNDAFVWLEAGPGPGEAVQEYLKHGYAYRRETYGMEDYKPWRTTAASRELLMSNLRVAAQEDELKVMDSGLEYELRNFVINGKGRPEAARGVNDDRVMALAMAIQGHTELPGRPRSRDLDVHEYQRQLYETYQKLEAEREAADRGRRRPGDDGISWT